jgi:UDP-2-acetamido-2-deoxy-ribo-hexuluronate aminotransferase
VVHGQSRRYVHTRVGVGGRMDTLQCAVVLAKLERFDWELAQRQRAADSYEALLSGRLQLVGQARDRTNVYAQYTVVVEERERIQAELHAAGIPTAVHYPVPMHLQPAYAHLSRPDACPVASSMAARVLSLPMGPYLEDSEARRVAQALLRALRIPVPATELAAAPV